MSGKSELRYVAIYDLTNNIWKSLEGGTVNAPCRVLMKPEMRDELYLGGLFTHVNEELHVSYIAKYDLEKNTWHSLSGGLQGYCNSLAIDDASESLYVGGTFINAGEGENSVDAHHIAKYNMKTSLWDNMAGGVNNVVHSIYHDTESKMLFIGGSFTNTYENDIVLNYIAKYNPEKNEWSALENYFPNTNPKEPNHTVGLDGGCKGISIDGKSLYIAGKFRNAGNISANSIARYALTRSSL